MAENKDKTIEQLRAIYRVFAEFKDEVFIDDKGNKRNNNSRLWADVVRRGCEDASIDAYLIMINPGSCKPDPNGAKVQQYAYYRETEAIEAVSDPAQKCVMLLMDEGNLNKIRLLNLIDYADGNIENATSVMKSESALEKSLFSASRACDREKIMGEDAPIIIAWGLDDKCPKLKKQAYECIQNRQPIGVHVSAKGEYAYKYIKPYSIAMQQDVRRELLALYRAL